MRFAAKILVSLSLATCALSASMGSGHASESSAPDPAYAKFDAAVAAGKAALMGDPREALARAEEAIARARELGHSPRAEIAMATAEWLQGEAYIGLNKVDVATPIISDALARVERFAPNTKLHGDLTRSQGAIHAMSGKMQEALADFQRAFEIFRKAGEVRSQAIALQEIGQIYWEAGDYPRVLQYYSQASELFTADPAFSLTSHNNLAEVYRKLERYEDAERELGIALAAARKLNSPLLEARILINLAATQVKRGKYGPAQRNVDIALGLARSGKTQGWEPFIYGSAAMVAEARGDDQRAAMWLGQAFAGTDLKTTPLAFRELHEIAAAVFERLGDQNLALAHLKAFQRLDSEARNLTASANSQLMSARFDFANQNLRISQLKQGQLERDIRIERQQSQFRLFLFVGLAVAGAIVFALLLISALRIRKSRNETRAANAVLTRVNIDLEKALKAKTEFLAMTSHEIRTPLNGILGMTQIMLTNKKVSADVREQVEVVQGAGEAMRALVDDILDVAKMQTGEVTVSKSETALVDTLRDAVRLWRGHADAKKLIIGLETGNAPKHIVSDGAKIRQIVSNLLSNAVKFTPTGFVVLTAAAEKRGNDEVLVITVKDTGIGIAPEHHELVFEAFQQVDGGTNRQFSGTGLGLAICRNLATALGGSITIASAIGEGATFTVVLPLERVDRDQAAKLATSVGPPATLADARLLLVEGNAMTQGILRGLLEPVVRSLDCVETGDAALNEVAAGTVDHLLIEASSAVANHDDALGCLRSIIEGAAQAGVPVTLLLAPTSALPLGDVAQLGATQLVLKPVGAAQLLATLNDIYAPTPSRDEATAAAA